MKESRFIELLNLYVDQELSPPDAAELEAEIVRNPARRRTYEQYCRMQRACVLLFENERAPAPHLKKLAMAVRDADEKIVAFPGAARASAAAVSRSRSWRPAIWGAGLVAAAASVALVVMHRTPSGVTTAPVPATQVATVERAPALAAEEPVRIPQTDRQPRSHYRSVLIAGSLLRNQDSADAASLQFASEGSSLEWTKRVQLSPLQRVVAEDLKFESRSFQPAEAGTYRGRNSYGADVDLTAFQFQR